MATWIVGGVVLLAAAAAIWKIVRDRKKGACSCGGDCSRLRALPSFLHPRVAFAPRLCYTVHDVIRQGGLFSWNEI